MQISKDILRYNQGFGNFGTMEQVNNGKWVRADEVIPILDNLEQKERLAQGILAEVRKEKADVLHLAAVRTRAMQIDIKYARFVNRILAAGITYYAIVSIVIKHLF